MIERRVSIILVTFNCERTIQNLLKTVLSIDWENLELIIVDNGSEDATIRMIEEMMSMLKKKCTVKFLKLPKNMGHCYAANIAVNNSSGEFLCFIDHDIEMTPPVLRELVQHLELDCNVGAVQPKVLNAYEKEFIDSYDFNENGSMRGKKASLYAKSRKILYCIGAFCVIRRKIYDHIGRFYDDFFICNDVDFGWRLWLFGYTVKSVPTVEIYHSRGTLRKNKQINLIFEYHGFKNQIAMVIQNFETKNLIKYLLRLLRITLFSLLHNPSSACVKIKAFFWVVSHLELIIKRRHFIQHSRKINDDKLVDMLKHILPSPIAEEIKKKIHASEAKELAPV